MDDINVTGDYFFQTLEPVSSNQSFYESNGTYTLLENHPTSSPTCPVGNNAFIDKISTEPALKKQKQIKLINSNLYLLQKLRKITPIITSRAVTNIFK